ncbi:MAG: hypothetical protein AAGG38_00585 [Planctomycetota bacterium]
MIAKLFWAALLSSQAMLIAVALILAPTPADDPDAAPVFSASALAGFITVALTVPLAYFLRNQVYKSQWQAHAVTPRGYLTGNLVFLGLLETSGAIASATAIFEQRAWPNLIPALVVLALFLANFPHGRPLDPAPPRLGVSEK